MMITNLFFASRVVIFAIAITVLLPLRASGAADLLPDLYNSAAIVTGQELPNRIAAASVALPRVLVKVSGDPSVAADPKVKLYADRAINMLAGFTYRDQMAGIPVRDEQGTRDRPYDLTLQFDPVKIGEILQKLGRRPWSGARPKVVVVFSLDQGAWYTVSSDDMRSLGPREALYNASERAGLDVALPTADQISTKLNGMKPFEVPAETREYLAVALVPVTSGSHVVLTGEAVWDDDILGWRTDWQIAANGKIIRWRIERVSYDEAFRNGLIGAAQILSGHGVPPRFASGATLK
ncbi:DUF2066 domain-containing protein [soil metagenome]